jgi:hypothetical protein
VRIKRFEDFQHREPVRTATLLFDQPAKPLGLVGRACHQDTDARQPPGAGRHQGISP